MNSVLLEAAIRTRLVQSASTASVAIQGCWSTVAPAGTELKVGASPFIVFELLSGLEDDTFSYNAIKATYRVTIYDHKDNGTTSAAALHDAVKGNGTPSTPPTMGLHRWDATVSGSTVSQCERIRFGYGHTGEILVYWNDFEVHAQEA